MRTLLLFAFFITNVTSLWSQELDFVLSKNDTVVTDSIIGKKWKVIHISEKKSRNIRVSDTKTDKVVYYLFSLNNFEVRYDGRSNKCEIDLYADPDLRYVCFTTKISESVRYKVIYCKNSIIVIDILFPSKKERKKRAQYPYFKYRFKKRVVLKYSE